MGHDNNDYQPIENDNVHPIDYLNAKYYSFFIGYLEHGDATKATIEAGYSPKSAHSQGWRLLRDATIQRAIDWEKNRIRKSYQRTHEHQTAYLTRAQNLQVSDFFKYDPESKKMILDQQVYKKYGKYIEKIKVTAKGDIEITLFSKQTAADMLAKHVGYYEKDNNQKVGPGVQFYMPGNGRDEPEGMEQ